MNAIDGFSVGSASSIVSLRYTVSVLYQIDIQEDFNEGKIILTEKIENVHVIDTNHSRPNHLWRIQPHLPSQNTYQPRPNQTTPTQSHNNEKWVKHLLPCLLHTYSFTLDLQKGKPLRMKSSKCWRKPR